MKYLSFLAVAGFIFASNMVFTGQAHATIYKCVKTNGKVVYNDKPCATKDAETTLKHEKAPKNPYIPSITIVSDDVSDTNSKVAGAKQLAVTSASTSQESKNNKQVNADSESNNQQSSSSSEVESDNRDSEVIHAELSRELGRKIEVELSPEEQEQKARYPDAESKDDS